MDDSTSNAGAVGVLFAELRSPIRPSPGNTGGHWTNVASGGVADAGTAGGTNARSVMITNSMVQGVR
jgi:hypothetical protein